MNIVDFIIEFYGYLTPPTKILSPLRFVTRKVADKLIPVILNNKKYQSLREGRRGYNRTKKIIVSFTSFPARIDKVWVVVQCMKRQSIRPDKILLWLSKDQFKEIPLPESLISLVDDMFEIRMVDNDYRSHKKYCYAFKEYRDDIVVLIDDDIYYQSTMIEKLLKGLETHPDSIICQYGSIMKYNDDGTLPPFNSWWEEKRRSIDSKDLFLGTGGGSMFMPDKITDLILDTKLAMRLTPQADDIWVNAMIRLSGLSIFKIKSGIPLQLSEVQTSALKNNNAYEGQNDVQFKNVIDYFVKERDVNPFCKRNYK